MTTPKKKTRAQITEKAKERRAHAQRAARDRVDAMMAAGIDPGSAWTPELHERTIRALDRRIREQERTTAALRGALKRLVETRTADPCGGYHDGFARGCTLAKGHDGGHLAFGDRGKRFRWIRRSDDPSRGRDAEDSR